MLVRVKVGLSRPPSVQGLAAVAAVLVLVPPTTALASTPYAAMRAIAPAVDHAHVIVSAALVRVSRAAPTARITDALATAHVILRATATRQVQAPTPQRSAPAS